MANYTLSPSLLAADFLNLGHVVRLLEQEQISHLHLDIMDGHFVPAISYGLPIVEALSKQTRCFLDAHLMISNPKEQIPLFIKAGVHGITIHVEAAPLSDIKDCLNMIKNAGLKAGLSLKPATKVLDLLPFKEELDLVLLMSVEPGAGGQSFMPESLERAKEIKNLLPQAELQIDGGINLSNLKEAQKAGATNFVAGTALLKGDITQNIRAFKNILEDCLS